MSQILHGWICVHKAATTWFHAAHHVTKGTGFAGDHGILYDRIYTEYQEDFDGIVEKVLGATNDEKVACPIHLLMGSANVIDDYKSPINCDPLTIASTALELTKDYIDMLEHIFEELESQGNLSLGMNDMIAALANKYETHVYLLQQRIKEHVEKLV